MPITSARPGVTCWSPTNPCSWRLARTRSTTIISTPPANSAIATGKGPNKCALIVLCSKKPIAAAGSKGLCQGRGQPQRGDVASYEPGHARGEQAPIMHDHRQDGAELNHDVERLRALARFAQELADQIKCPVEENRQVLGQAFDDAQQYRNQ